MNDLFVARLGNVTIAVGAARLDFLRVESIDNEKKQITLKPSIRLAMPLDGLVQATRCWSRSKRSWQRKRPSSPRRQTLTCSKTNPQKNSTTQVLRP